MRVNNISLPHPVLGKKDDVSGFYSPQISCKLGRDEIQIKIKHQLSNKSIRKLINDKIAVFTTELVCSKTFFRKSFTTADEEQTLVIPSEDLRDTVTIRLYITAEEEIIEYKIPEFNSDYGSFTFQISKGDVLAYGGKTDFFAPKGYSLITISSLMVISSNNNQNGPFDIDLNEEKIVVKLSINDYNMYSEYKKVRNLYPLFHSTIVFPVLMHTLISMKENAEEYKGIAWYESLRYRLLNEKPFKNNRSSQLNTQDIPDIAQLLLKNPTERALMSVEGLVREIEGD
jgi:hypothetical protein